MKRFILLTFCWLILLNLSAQRQVYSLKLHEKYNLDLEMSVKTVCEILDLDLAGFKEEFHLKLDDVRIDRTLLSRLDISLDAVYQYYCLKRYGFNDFSKIGDVCLLLNIPYTKMAVYLHLNPQKVETRNLTIRDLHRETLEIIDIKQQFKREELQFSSYLTVLGICVVFTALLIIALIVSQIKVLAKKTILDESKAPSIITTVGKVITQQVDGLNENAIAAVIATIHKLKMDSISEHKILMTWRRANINMWRASGKADFPTIKYNMVKKGR